MSSSYARGSLPLTRAQRNVLELAARGLTVKESARELGRSASTVKDERAAACARLGARNVVAAVYAATRSGELP